MKLNLELTEKKMKGMIPQAEKPKDTVGKAPWTKGSKFDPKAPKAKTASLKQPEYKKDLKFAKKGSPLKTGTVQPGKTPSAPSSKGFGFKQPFVSKQKEVGMPTAPKMYKSKAAVPDAMDVTKRGVTNASAGDAIAKFSTAVKKAIMPSKASKNVTIAKAKIVKPSLGFGVLKPGGVMDTLGNTSMTMSKVAKPPAPKSYSGKSPSVSFKESRKPLREFFFYDSDCVFEVMQQVDGNDSSMHTSPKNNDLSVYFQGGVATLRPIGTASSFKEAQKIASDALDMDPGKKFVAISKEGMAQIRQSQQDNGIGTMPHFYDGIASWHARIGFVNSQNSMNESVFNGSVEIHVAGRLKAVFEAATPDVVAKRALDYATIGARVEIAQVARGRTVYADPEFAALMIESEHARHHGLPFKDLRISAMKRAHDLLSSERDPRVHTKDTWLRECLGGLMKQAVREFRAAYKNSLNPYDVTVVTEGKRYRKYAMAVDERHAAAFAVDSVLAEDIEASIRGVFVGAKKFLPESSGKSMFMRFPEPFGEMSTALKIKKSPMGKTAEMKVGSVPELKIGGSRAPKGAASLGIKSNTKFDAGSEKSSLVDRNGSKYKPGKPLTMDSPTKDKGPVYESGAKKNFFETDSLVEDASQRVLDLIDQATDMAEGREKKAFKELGEKVRADEDLTDAENAALERFIGLALKK